MDLDQGFLADAILFGDETESDRIAVWTLDELDRSANLGSIRSAWTRTDDPTV